MDPFTRGHKHIVDLSLMIFDRLEIGVGINPGKRDPLFSESQRVDMTIQCVAEYGARVSVRAFEGVTVDLATEIGATAIIRGIRNGTDHAYEANMAFANMLMGKVEHGRVIPTVYFQCSPDLTEISSTRARELIRLRRHKDVLRTFVQEPVISLIDGELH